MKKLIAVFFLFGLFFAPALKAQEAQNIKYVSNTLENVSDVLFRKGILRADDPAAIEEYIRLHECGLYEQYGNDDFAWARIRDAYARNLKINLNTLPDGIEISSALPLTQYDIANSEFPIALEGQMENMGLVNVLRTQNGAFSPCDGAGSSSFVPRVHPLELTVKIDKPITFKSIPMDQSVADRLINEMNKRKIGLEAERRQATLVMRIRLTNADPLTGITDPLRRTVLGLIDDFRVYNGPDRKELLFRVDYQTQREKDQKK